MHPARPSRLGDPTRLAALDTTGLLGSPPEEAFDRLTRLACRTIRTPASMLTLIGADQQFIKSSLGLPEPLVAGTSVPVTHSLCRYVVAFGKPVLIQDTGEYRRLRQNPVVRATHSRSYLGVPLRTENGGVVGALCAIDRVPRAWSPIEVEALQDIAAVAGEEIATRERQRRAHRDSETLQGALRESEKQIAAARDLEREHSFAQLLQRIAVAANESAHIEDAFQACLDEVCRLTGWPVGHA